MDKMHFIEKYMILGIVLFSFVVLTGYSFAYFTVKTSVSGSGGSVTSKLAKLPKVAFNGGSAVNGNRLLPGEKITKTFDVTFTPTDDFKTINYNVKFNITNNTFQVCSNSVKVVDGVTNNCQNDAEELVYVLKRTIGEDGKEEVLKTENITNGVQGSLIYKESVTQTNVEVVYHYTLEVEFKNISNGNQLHNMGKIIEGSVDVAFTQ